MRGIVTILVMWCASLFFACTARAQLQAGDALTPVVARMPESTQVVVISGRPGAALQAIRGPWQAAPFTAGLGAETLAQWAVLSRSLGYEPREAFDNLTSGGVALIVMRSGQPEVRESKGDSSGRISVGARASVKGGVQTVIEPADGALERWVVLSVVKRGVADRVRQKLEAVPREVIGGLPLLSVEGGRFVLISRSLGAAATSDEVLALAPSQDRALLESVAKAVEGLRADNGARGAPAGTLGATAHFGMAQAMQCDLLVMVDSSNGALAKSPWSEGSVIACRLGAEKWSITARTSVSVAEGANERMMPMDAALAALYAKWSRGASLAVAMGPDRELSSLLVSAMELPGLSGVDGFTFSVHPAGPMPGGLPGDGPSKGRVLGAAIAKGDAAGIASAIDRSGCGLVNSLTANLAVLGLPDIALDKGAGQKSTATLEPAMFEGLGPHSQRRVKVKVGPGSLGGPFFGSLIGTEPRPVTVSWSQDPQREPGAARWVFVSAVGGSELSAARDEGAAIVRGDDAEAQERRWLWRALVRPARLADTLPFPISLSLGVSGIGLVKAVRADSWLEGGGGAHGRDESIIRTEIELEWSRKAWGR